MKGIATAGAALLALVIAVTPSAKKAGKISGEVVAKDLGTREITIVTPPEGVFTPIKVTLRYKVADGTDLEHVVVPSAAELMVSEDRASVRVLMERITRKGPEMRQVWLDLQECTGIVISEVKR